MKIPPRFYEIRRIFDSEILTLKLEGTAKLSLIS